MASSHNNANKNKITHDTKSGDFSLRSHETGSLDMASSTEYEPLRTHEMAEGEQLRRTLFGRRLNRKALISFFAVVVVAVAIITVTVVLVVYNGKFASSCFVLDSLWTQTMQHLPASKQTG